MAWKHFYFLALVHIVYKGALRLGNWYQIQARLTPKVQFVWLVLTLHAVHWHGWKRWASARYSCLGTSTGTGVQLGHEV